MKTTESPVWTSLEPFGVWGWSFFRWYTQKSLLNQGSLDLEKSLSYQGSLGKKSLLDQGSLAVDRWPSPKCEDLVNFPDFLLTDRWPGPDPPPGNSRVLGSTRDCMDDSGLSTTKIKK